jgi:hypothetical protein|tara:strand:+ start:349 stop:1296 length:948 start_codon:yes stop_codon:yes gene_type:complete
MQKQKRQTLNQEKRNTIANVFQSHWEREDSPVMQKYYEAKETYNQVREQMKSVVESIVRKYQPTEDVETIRAMNKKYGNSGGELYHDNCFRFRYNYQKVDDEGNVHDEYDNADVNFSLDDVRSFGYAYYRDEIKAKGHDADFKYRWSDEKRNPRYYEQEENIDKFLGFRNSSNEDKGQAIKPNAEWENDFKLWVIGTSYCHTRQFIVNETEYKILNTYNVARDNVIMAHEKIFEYTNEKMKKLRLGLKSYRYFDQAKELADKLGVPLNESVLNESSSLALSVYSPSNLASLLEDKVEMTREEKIAMFRQSQQSVN